MLVVAAVLCFVLGAAHSLLGERYILVRLFRRGDMPVLFGDDTFTRRTLRFAWHLTTITWWGIAAMLLVLATPAADLRSDLLFIVTATFAVSALLTLLASRGRHLAWILFAAVAALAALSA